MREIKFRIWDGETKEYVKDGWTYGFRIYANRNIQGPDPLGEIFEQFTGLKDKNCKEIYEGDICRIVRYNGELQTAGDIFFDKGAFRITNGYAVADTDSLGRFKADIVEVIGNIHENPELLK